MDNFDANHDDSIQFEEFMVVLSAYLIPHKDILTNLNASSGYSKCSKS